MSKELIEEAKEFLKSKKMIKPTHSEFIINGDFGKIELTKILSEFAEQQNTELKAEVKRLEESCKQMGEALNDLTS